MKNLFILFATLICAPLVACANPDYVQKDKGQSESEVNGQCDIYFEKLEACAKVTFKNAAVTSSDSPFQLEFTHFDNPDKIELVKIANLESVLWMPAMGHGSSPTTSTRVNDIKFEVTNVYFIMGGDWEIRFKLTNPQTNKTLDTGIFRITI